MIESVSFGAVRARMVASVVWLVADVLILTVWAVAKAVMTDNRWQMVDGRWQMAGAVGVKMVGWRNWYYFERGQARKGVSRPCKNGRAGWTWNAQCRLECDGQSYDRRCNRVSSFRMSL